MPAEAAAEKATIWILTSGPLFQPLQIPLHMEHICNIHVALSAIC